MRRIHILHRTYYNFAAFVRLNPHRLMMRPREGRDVHIEAEKLEITPAATLRWLRDECDNYVAVASFDAPARQLVISSEVVVRHEDANPFEFLVDETAVHYPFHFDAETQVALQPLIAQPEESGDRDALLKWIHGFWKPGESIETYGLLWRLCSAIPKAFQYQRREEPGVQRVAETLSRGSGTCRDFARLLMEAARVLGLPARFVSGYLCAPNAVWDFGATHAWVEIYLPGAGWLGFDPTLGELANGKHVAVAIGRVADAVPPIRGSFYGPSSSHMSVGVWVTELAER
ncbi:MAG: transglutaminase family protein [Steroidobacteraceae bacterium]